MSFGASMKEAVDGAALLQPHHIGRLGTTLVVAPHPDDESLACGGLIALLAAAGNRVWVLFVSDGSQSHPGSKKFPAPARIKLREAEALEALHLLRVTAAHAFFLRLPDAAVPMPGADGFPHAVAHIQSLLNTVQPDTIVLPWRRDPHPDHRACWQLVQAAVGKMDPAPLQLEYPLWLWERGAAADLPAPGETTFYKIDISSAFPLKQAAIAAHRSQVSNLIDDDPAGFRLSAGMLAHFAVAYEIYLTTNSNFNT